MAKMYTLCDGNGAFKLDLKVDGCYCSARADASFYYMGKPGGLRVRDLVLPGPGLFGGAPASACVQTSAPSRRGAQQKPSVPSFTGGRVHAQPSNQPVSWLWQRTREYIGP